MAQAEEFKFTFNLTLNTLRIDIVFIGLLMCQCCPLMETVSQWSHVFLTRWRTGLIDFLKIQIILFFSKLPGQNLSLAWPQKIRSSTFTADNTQLLMKFIIPVSGRFSNFQLENFPKQTVVEAQKSRTFVN